MPDCKYCGGSMHVTLEQDGKVVYERCKCYWEKNYGLKPKDLRFFDSLWKAYGDTKFLGITVTIDNLAYLKKGLGYVSFKNGKQFKSKNLFDLVSVYFEKDKDTWVSIFSSDLLLMIVGISELPNKLLHHLWRSVVNERVQRGDQIWVVFVPNLNILKNADIYHPMIFDTVSEWDILNFNDYKLKLMPSKDKEDK